MNRLRHAARRHCKCGSIAVEAALVLPILILFVGFPSILLAFYFRQYTAAQKAAHDVALYLSTTPRAELTTAGPDGNFAALTVANKIVAKELSGIVPNSASVAPAIYCIYAVGTGTPTKPCTPAILKLDTHTLFRFDVGINIPFIDPLTGNEVDSLYMAALSSARYVGN